MLQRSSSGAARRPSRSRVSRRSVSAARLALAPSGLIAAGAGVGIGEVAGLPLAATVTLAVFAWLVRLSGAISVRWWRRLPLVTIDPIAVSEPWRSLVREALGARQRFDQIVAQLPDGPLHDRLVDAGPVVHGATDEVWRVAQLGSSMAAPDRYVLEDLTRRMRALQRHPSPVPRGPGGFDEEAALAQQLQAIRHRQETATRVETHVRHVVTNLNVAVTDVAGLALGANGGVAPFETIEALSSDLGALHQAISEIAP